MRRLQYKDTDAAWTITMLSAMFTNATGMYIQGDQEGGQCVHTSQFTTIPFLWFHCTYLPQRVHGQGSDERNGKKPGGSDIIIALRAVCRSKWKCCAMKVERGRQWNGW